MEEEALEPGSPEAPQRPASEPPPRRARRGSSSNLLFTLLGLSLALIAALIYFFGYLRPARQRALEEVARFTAIEGEVKVKPSATQEWTQGRQAMILRAGDVVQTAPLAGAELSFRSGNVVRLRPDSVVLIGDTADTSEATWRVQAGQVNFELSQKTEIATPTATASTSANSEGNISVEDGGDTGIKIFKGSAQVATIAGDNILLNENEAVKVDAKGKAGRKSILPVPPQTVAPPAQAELVFKKAPDTTTRLQWNVVAGGETYRVAMDYNVVQANLLLSAALDQPGIRESHHDLTGLDPGKYYWRVAGVNAEGEEGKYSRVSNFAVVMPQEPAKAPPASTVRVEPLEVMGSVVALRGKVAPGSTVTVDGAPVRVAPDGTFSEFLRRGAPREITIRVTGPGGEVTEEKRPVP